METRKYKIKISANSVSGGNSFWLADSSVFALSSHGGKRESSDVSSSYKGTSSMGL